MLLLLDKKTYFHPIAKLLPRYAQTLILIKLRKQVPQSQIAILHVLKQQSQGVAQKRSLPLSVLQNDVTMNHVAPVQDLQGSARGLDVLQDVFEVFVHFDVL